MKNPLKFLFNRLCAWRIGLSDVQITQLRKQISMVTLRTEKSPVASLIRTLSPVRIEGKPLIRIGPDGDGGYLVPDDLSGIETCFSVGVGPVSGFEKECARRGMNVFLADNSVEQPAESDEKFHFTRKHVGVLTTDSEMTLDRWVADSLPDSRSDLLLQMDVEGAEYEILCSMTDQLAQRFRIVVVEFHDLDQLWNQAFFNLAVRVFNKLLQTHTCVHIHPNNVRGLVKENGLEIPQVAEFTFLRKDRVCNPSPARIFPHPFDQNNAAMPELPLPPCWYRAG
ncbi:MAG: FkbM family methyltransferase [Kiritimatiellales bacterium]|nr:FkbM family methyltransferase [Kiritimatiellales bacterium]